MKHVVFAAPFFLEATVRFLAAAARLDGVRLSLVSQDPMERLPAALRGEIAGHRRIEDGLDPDRITRAVDSLAREFGPVHRLIGALEQLQLPLAIVRERLGVEGLGVESARNFRDKARMKARLRAAGVPCARHRLVSSGEEAVAFVREIGFPVVAKPPSGAGARHTFRVDGEHELRELVGMLSIGPERPMLLEEFVVGDEHSFETVSIRARPVWHSLTRYLPAPLDVLRNPWIQWCVLLPREVDDPRYDDIRREGFRALEVLGMGTGLSHMEWFRRRDGTVAISEVGARPPGAQFTTLMSYAHDLDFYGAWARLVVHDTFDPPPRRYAAGIAFLRGQGQGRVRAIHGLDRAQQELGPLVVEVRLPRPGAEPSGGYEGEGYVVLRHPETATVEVGLRRLVSLVRVELG
jgi:phosphoribosylaminoimidazole carboxylase (NCAIR synthetase)